MLSVSSGDYVVLCEDDGLPELYDYYRQNAVLVEEFDLDNPDCSVCFVGLQRDSETPFLVVAQSYSPSEFGFDPGVQLIEETGVLFVGAGERLLAYDLERATRLWEDEADEGFHRWSRHDSTVMMEPGRPQALVDRRRAPMEIHRRGRDRRARRNGKHDELRPGARPGIVHSGQLSSWYPTRGRRLEPFYSPLGEEVEEPSSVQTECCAPPA